MRIRRVVVVLGDQLNEDSVAFAGFDPAQDCVWMAEVREESTHVPSSKSRTVMFLAAMRHFRDALKAKGWRVKYTELDDEKNCGTLAGELTRFLKETNPREVVAVEPGEWRLREELKGVLWPDAGGDWLEDSHFLCTRNEFEAHAANRKQLRMEYFYREMRKRHGVLMDQGQPAGGVWNFDTENRGAFGKNGPVFMPAPVSFKPDPLTLQVMAVVGRELPDAPGEMAHFDFPVTRPDALAALSDFVERRLPYFGVYQDAMWTGEPWLYHARISAALNLKLLNPTEVLSSAEEAWKQGRVPIEAAEGFIRQILGWREYVRGVYWLQMPGYSGRNAMNAAGSLPSFYWSGDTQMHCLRQAIGQTLKYGYAHHIQRLMVTGLFAMLLGVDPKAVHEWYLSVYVDAVEWVELPNTLGMSQYADGGVMASKPYAATGKYIQRMSNYCSGCRFNPAVVTGPDACPFTTLYWDFLATHRTVLAKNQRMSLQIKNLERLNPEALAAIRSQARHLRATIEASSV